MPSEIRLYEFNRSEAQRLRQLVNSLVTGDRKDAALQDEMWVEPVDRCCLKLRVGLRNEGVRQAQPLRFECVLSPEGWNNVEELLEPFSETGGAGFQWLTTDGSVSTHLSQTANGKSPASSLKP